MSIRFCEPLRGLELWLLGVASVGCAAQAPQAPLVLAPPVVSVSAAPTLPKAPRPKVIVFVWDGLRPDSVSAENTPNLARLRDHDGVNFVDHHSVYPTFTMMNAAALATGAYPGRHGFFGNTEYQPGPSGRNADGKATDFAQPVFTEDHGVLQALDAFYRGQGGRGVFAVETLFEVAHRAGLRTAAIGKIGPAFLQDLHPDAALGVMLDENVAVPFEFARGLQESGFALPANTLRYPYGDGRAVTLAPSNGDPSAPRAERLFKLEDGATPDPRASAGTAHAAANGYLMTAYLEYVLPRRDPDLSVVWLRNPDSTEHQFGPGSPNYLDALRDQDALLGKLLSKLTDLGLQASTDLLVVSDHGHSTVAGDPKLFPLRALNGKADGHGKVGALDAQGYPVSGEIRTADVLTRAGFAHVYDGGGCVFDPVLSGIREDGSRVYPTRRDETGACAAPPTASPTAKKQAPAVYYSMPGFRVPEPPPKDAIIIAANGGTEYFYVLDHAPATVQKLVLALQVRRAYGAIFVRSSYGAIPGTLPLSAIGAEGERPAPPTPDLMVSFTWDDSAVVAGNAAVPGTEYASAQRYRGIHGSFSPRDVHNTLIACGPHFKAGFTDSAPTGNVDLAKTVASLLGLSFGAPDGRVLREAFVGNTSDLQVEIGLETSGPVHLRKTCNPDDPSCIHGAGPATYSVTLSKKVLTVTGTRERYTYLDSAVVAR